MVSNLFYGNSRNWNTHLIWKTFEKSTAREILNTYVSKSGEEDKVHWVGTQNGKISVKSFYAYQIRSNMEETREDNSDRFWKKPWSTSMLPKWKMFIWKCLNKSLPLRKGLKKRNIIQDSNCVFDL